MGNHTVSLVEKEAQNAIDNFLAQSCVFILPGMGPPPAMEVGSGTILKTGHGHLVILTAKHVGRRASTEEYRLGYLKCVDAVSDFVAAVVPHPMDDVDVALLVVKEGIATTLGNIAAPPQNVPMAGFEILPGDALVLNGYPAQASYYLKERAEQGFYALTYWCHYGPPLTDSHSRYQIPWRNFGDPQPAEANLETIPPRGMSGGPLWRFRKPSGTTLWSPGRIGRIVGVQSAWDQRETVLIEPIAKWSNWFHQSLKEIDNTFG
jgi:hypothetical protein